MIINFYILLLSKLTKVDENKVIYIPVNFKYLGNAKAIVNEWRKLKNYKHVYLLDRNEYDVNLIDDILFIKFGIKFLYHYITAKYVIRESEYNSIGLLTKQKQIIIQLWHAAGAFKKFGLDIPERSNFLKKQRIKDISTWSMLLCSSTEIIDIYSKAFGGFDKNKIFVCGLPRNDVLFELNKRRNELKQKTSHKHIILFAPTFRDKFLPEEHFFLIEYVQYIINKLPAEYVIGVRLHPSIYDKINTKIFNIDNVLNLNICSTEEALIVSDMLITDYSSIIFDYALLEKPMLFFAPDLNLYFDKRGFYFDYEDFVPGKICKDTDTLVNEILNYNFNYWLPKILEFKKKFNPYFDGKNSERIVKKILEIK